MPLPPSDMADSGSASEAASTAAVRALDEKFSKRFDRLEHGLAVILEQLSALQRNRGGAGSSSTDDHPAPTGKSDLSVALVDPLIRNLVEEAVKLYADASGRLDAKRLMQALQEVGAFGKGSINSIDAVAQLMKPSLADGGLSASDSLDVHATVEVVLRGIASGAVELPVRRASGEAKEEEELDAEDPWATVLRGDAQLRSLVADMRNAAGRSGAMARGGLGGGRMGGEAGGAAPAPAMLLGMMGAGSRSSSSSRCVLHPNGSFKTGWNLFMAALICFCAVAVPLEIGYDASLHRALGPNGWSAWISFNYFVDIVFVLDIVLSFRTGFLVDGHHLVSDWRLIAISYLRGTFIIDLVGSFPFNLAVDLANQLSGGGDNGGGGQGEATARLNKQLRLLRIAKLNRLLRLSKLSSSLKAVEVMLSFNPSAFRVLKLVLVMVCCCHYMGCAWWLVAGLELESALTPQNSWQPDAFLLNSDLGTQFASGFFWGAGIVTAMVPYDVMPQTQIEYYVTATCMFIGLVLNAFVIGSMASALATLDSKKQICRGKLETIGLYLVVNNVTPDLRARILEYYEYVYTSSQSMEDLNLLRDLPPSLATRLAISVHRKIVVRLPLFNTLTDHALLAVLSRLRPLIFVPGQVVLVQGEHIKAVTFIKKGRIAMLTGMGTDTESEVRMLGPSDNFGLDEQSTRELSSTSVSAGPGGQLAGLHAMAPLRATRMSASSFSRHSAAMARPGGGWQRAYLMSRRVQLSARAVTYCDVVTLDVLELADILHKDREVQSRNRTSTVADTATTAGTCLRFVARMVKNKNKKASTAAATAAAPGSSQPAAEGEAAQPGSGSVWARLQAGNCKGAAAPDAAAEGESFTASKAAARDTGRKGLFQRAALWAGSPTPAQRTAHDSAPPILPGLATTAAPKGKKATPGHVQV